MLSSLKSYVNTQYFTEKRVSVHDSSEESTKSTNIAGNEGFISGLKEVISFASESSAKLAVELKSAAKKMSDKITTSVPFIEFVRAHSDFIAERRKVEPVDGALSYSTELLYAPIDNNSTTDIDSQQFRQQLKDEILRLSTDEQNFLRPPPHGSCFRWCPRLAALHMPLALALLKEDENLASMRFRLVPRRMKEDDFWRNFFYRVSLIRQSVNLPGAIPFPQYTDVEPEPHACSPGSSKTRTPGEPKTVDCQQKQGSEMASPATLSLSTDSMDEIEAELILEDGELDNTVIIDEDLEREILAELNDL